MPDKSWGPAIFKSRHNAWAKRAHAAASLMRDDRWVCDVGCGSQLLRWFLPLRAVYLPADIELRSPETEICDLDTGDLPWRYLRLCDVAVLLGVVSHLKDPQAALDIMRPYVEFVVVSTRSNYNIESLLKLTGFVIVGQKSHGPYVIVRAVNPAFSDESRHSRSFARKEYRRRLPSLTTVCKAAYYRISF